MTSKLGRINEAVRRRSALYTGDCPMRVSLKVWKGQSIITVWIRGVKPSHRPILNLAYRGDSVRRIGRETFPAGPAWGDTVTSADVLAWLDRIAQCIYLDINMFNEDS